jgi:hypothetical protein
LPFMGISSRILLVLGHNLLKDYSQPVAKGCNNHKRNLAIPLAFFQRLFIYAYLSRGKEVSNRQIKVLKVSKAGIRLRWNGRCVVMNPKPHPS